MPLIYEMAGNLMNPAIRHGSSGIALLARAVLTGRRQNKVEPLAIQTRLLPMARDKVEGLAYPVF